MSASYSSAAKQKTRVLAVDDHPLYRQGVIQLVNRQPDLVCCGEAATVAETRRAVVKLQPDIVLLDLRLSDGDGLDLLPELSETHPGIRVIALSQSDESVYAHRTLKAGARGYIMKSEATEVVTTAIRTVLRGEIYLSRQLESRLLRNLFPDPSSKAPELAHLSDRELQVFQLLGVGCGTRAIAERLKISPKTVQTYREQLLTKLTLPNSAALLRTATHWVETGRLDVSVSGSPPASSFRQSAIPQSKERGTNSASTTACATT